ncbi:MAG: RDD family protein [Cytophagaceae bacterium]
MKKIEIYTNQNVSIEYKLATLQQRILAFIIDFIIILVSASLLTLVFAGMFSSELVVYFVSAPIFFFYSLFFEIFNDGKSLGKAALGIRVAKLSGQNLSLNDYLTRWVFRMVDIYFTLGAAASFLISSSRKNQRIGDVLANTSVINFKPDYSFNLSKLINRKSLDNYMPTYPGARKFKEEDMLLLKTVIDRTKKYRNPAHQEALNMMAHKVKNELDLKELPKNRVAFLETVLKDYVIMTR